MAEDEGSRTWHYLEPHPLLARITVDGERPRVVLVLDTLNIEGIFAGVKTAFTVALELARRLDRPLAVVVLEPVGGDQAERRKQLADWLRRELGATEREQAITLSTRANPERSGFHHDDVWVATFWTTALQLGYRCRAGHLRADRVIYLVQDWEPGFYAWGTLHALAESTYTLGFRLLVNSRPLAGFVEQQTGIPIPAAQTVIPQVDAGRLAISAKNWRPGSPQARRVLFYARPGKPRNMYELGIAALRQFVATLPPELSPVITLAGEGTTVPDLGVRAQVEVVGKLSISDYYDLLARVDLGLSLMHSPHPSHLALELPMAGVPTVTNALASHRSAWVPGLHVVPATAAELALELRELASVPLPDVHLPHELDRTLGRPLADCLDSLVRKLAAERKEQSVPESRGAPRGGQQWDTERVATRSSAPPARRPDRAGSGLRTRAAGVGRAGLRRLPRPVRFRIRQLKRAVLGQPPLRTTRSRTQ